MPDLPHTNAQSAGDPIPAKCELITVHVAELKQLFNAIDPSPFREKDLLIGITCLAVSIGVGGVIANALPGLSRHSGRARWSDRTGPVSQIGVLFRLTDMRLFMLDAVERQSRVSEIAWFAHGMRMAS